MRRELSSDPHRYCWTGDEHLSCSRSGSVVETRLPVLGRTKTCELPFRTFVADFHRDAHPCRDIPTNTLTTLQRLHSLAFGFGTFAYAKDRGSSLHDGLLREYPTPCSYSMAGFILTKWAASSCHSGSRIGRQQGRPKSSSIVACEKQLTLFIIARLV